jgi:hypothetical protein
MLFRVGNPFIRSGMCVLGSLYNLGFGLGANRTGIYLRAILAILWLGYNGLAKAMLSLCRFSVTSVTFTSLPVNVFVVAPLIALLMLVEFLQNLARRSKRYTCDYQ